MDKYSPGLFRESVSEDIADCDDKTVYIHRICDVFKLLFVVKSEESVLFGLRSDRQHGKTLMQHGQIPENLLIVNVQSLKIQNDKLRIGHLQHPLYDVRFRSAPAHLKLRL